MLAFCSAGSLALRRNCRPNVTPALCSSGCGPIKRAEVPFLRTGEPHGPVARARLGFNQVGPVLVRVERHAWSGRVRPASGIRHAYLSVYRPSPCTPICLLSSTPLVANRFRVVPSGSDESAGSCRRILNTGGQFGGCQLVAHLLCREAHAAFLIACGTDTVRFRRTGPPGRGNSGGPSIGWIEHSDVTKTHA